MSKTYDSRLAEAQLQQAGLLVEAADSAVSFSGISNNSKNAKAGDLFICKGAGFKSAYLQMAKELGAVCYVAESRVEGVDLPCILVNNSFKAQSILSRWFFENPSDEFTLVGVTGTKGKTTTTYMTHAVMNAVAGCRTGMTSGVDLDVGGGEVVESHLTTPDSLELQQLYAQARDHALPIVTSEISSQAYKVHRVFGQHFDYCIFLNISPDHISPTEHPDFEDYFECKLQLLDNSDVAVICRDTAEFETVYCRAQAACRRVCLVGKTEDCDYRFHDIVKQPSGYTFLVTEKDSGQTYPYSIMMDGQFNIKNAVAAIAVGRMMGGDPAKIAEELKDVTVAGRADVYTCADLTVVINYMHNGISCTEALQDLQKDYPGAYIVVVIGMAGERSAGRFIDIGQVCGQYADRVFFSSEDPGFDDPYVVTQQMAEAAAGGKAEVIVEVDRTKAVEQAILDAPKGSVVVLAGKGNETTMRVRGQYIPYESDPGIMRRVQPLRAKMYQE